MMEQEVVAKNANDPAAIAFDTLRCEVITLRLAIQQLAAAPHEIIIPDYTDTLAEMAGDIADAAKALTALRSSPALELSPQALAQQVAAAGAAARTVEQTALHTASSALIYSATELRGWVDTARLASVQNMRLMQTAGAAFLGGVLLWAMLPGVIVRAVPEGWHWPERMAAWTMRMDMWQAGQQLMIVANPDAWKALVDAEKAVRSNREAIDGCSKSARVRQSPVRCTIIIQPKGERIAPAI
jgi:Family of unknown function (DUF6118)